MTLPTPEIIAVLVRSAATCSFCEAKPSKCLNDEAGNLFPVCEQCNGRAWPLYETPMEEGR
jgi:hypothetical protein